MSETVYFDNAASAPVRPEAIEAVSAHLRAHAANPSSIHAAGQLARKALEAARGEVAALVGCEGGELVFVSGATEANNLAIRGVLEPLLRAGKRPHVVTTSIEHAAVRETLRDLEARGAETTFVDPGPDGVVPAQAVLSAVRPETALASVMAVSNETGAVQPVSAIAAGLKKLGTTRPLFHVDAVQGVVAEAFDFKAVGADLASFSAHKIGGPKGVGALAVRRGLVLHPAATGGGHENGRRSGTENAPGIAGFGAAAARLKRERGGDRARYESVRQAVLDGLSRAGVKASPVLPPGTGAPNILSLEVPGAEADWLVLLLSRAGVMISAGSACTSGTRKASPALAAMGLSEARARSVIRLSFGPDSATADADAFCDALKDALAKRP